MFARTLHRTMEAAVKSRCGDAPGRTALPVTDVCGSWPADLIHARYIAFFELTWLCIRIDFSCVAQPCNFRPQRLQPSDTVVPPHPCMVPYPACCLQHNLHPPKDPLAVTRCSNEALVKRPLAALQSGEVQWQRHHLQRAGKGVS